MVVGDLTGCVWSNQDVIHDNYTKGFDLWQSAIDQNVFIRVPLNYDATSIKTNGDTPPAVGFVWVHKRIGTNNGHNGAETKLLQPDEQALKDIADKFDVDPWFENGIPKPVSYEDIVLNYEDKNLWRNDINITTGVKSNWRCYI